ncbi:MAG: tyrosine-type recombinase/integrase [Thermoleophilia bacterium]
MRIAYASTREACLRNSSSTWLSYSRLRFFIIYPTRQTAFTIARRVGTPMDPDNVTKNFKRSLKRAGLRDQRFHDLRHCAATMMLSQGIPARVVMETLGALTNKPHDEHVQSCHPRPAGRCRSKNECALGKESTL